MEGMHYLNVKILDGDDELTHWTGSPSAEGGALRGIDMSPVKGPPVWDYDPTGNSREQLKFTIDTKIIGSTEAKQNSFIAKYKRGTIFSGAAISGMPTAIGWIVENALVKHSAEGNTASTLTITLAEIGVHADGSGEVESGS